MAEPAPAAAPPEVSLTHLDRMTDDVGLAQHAVYSAPRRQEGYATDDNARALVVVARCHTQSPSELTARLAQTYLAFLYHGLDEQGRFLTFLGYDRRWLDTEFSDDSHGRALWAAAEVVASSLPDSLRMVGRELFDRGIGATEQMVSPRGLALTLIALEAAFAASPKQEYRDRARAAADFLVAMFERTRSERWRWFEDSMTYDNARMPHALFCAHALAGEPRYLAVAEESLAFLDEMTTRDGLFVPIGTMGWANRAGRRALYDQQPVEAGTMAEAAVRAWQMTAKESYGTMARRAFDWFLGANTAGTPLADLAEGSCCDGLHAGRVNQNRGGEAAVSLLLAIQAMRRLNAETSPSPVRAHPRRRRSPARNNRNPSA